MGDLRFVATPRYAGNHTYMTRIPLSVLESSYPHGKILCELVDNPACIVLLANVNGCAMCLCQGKVGWIREDMLLEGLVWSC